MPYNVDNYPSSMANLDHLVRVKAFDLANSNQEDGEDEELLLKNSTDKAQAWFDSATEEDKEELRKRYPEDKLDELNQD